MRAVRLANFNTAARVLTLNAEMATMVITDYLGAAAAPWRSAVTNNINDDLYADSARGDAGVRTRTIVTFQLDLSGRDLSQVQRVLVQGTDPLRGFNISSSGISDYAGQPSIGWEFGGITLYDDGSNGDTNMGDGVYMRSWALSNDGTDTELVPDSPSSLVGGDLSTGPLFWIFVVYPAQPAQFQI
jgi:hypothetical protein